jgi:hypothetical protein
MGNISVPLAGIFQIKNGILRMEKNVKNFSVISIIWEFGNAQFATVYSCVQTEYKTRDPQATSLTWVTLAHI